MKVFNQDLGSFKLPNAKGGKGDVDYIGQGGQATVYATSDNKYAFKIYHDKSHALPEDKVKELSQLKDSNVITPIGLLYENHYVGYYMKFLKNKYNLCELFPKAFKNRNNFDISKRKDLVEAIMDLVMKVHNNKFLIVDLNADNVLVGKRKYEPYLIDTDSYQTPNYKATAIQDIIRDRTIKNNDFNQGSDWFSFACLAFQIYTNVHPYGGIHPQYKIAKGDVGVISQRMNNDISVFDKDVKFPPAVEDFKIIPKRHYDWFKDVFNGKGRTAPPKTDGAVIQKNPTSTIIIQSNDKLDVTEELSFKNIINDIYMFKGQKIYKTSGGFYNGKNKIHEDIHSVPTMNNKGKVIFLEKHGNNLKYKNITLPFDDYCIHNGGLYRLHEGNLYYDEIQEFAKTFSNTKKLADIGKNAILSQGVVLQNCLAANRAITFNHGKASQYFLSQELNNHSMISGGHAGNFIWINSKKRKHYQILFDVRNQEFLERRADYVVPNMISLQNGLTIRLNDDNLSLFKDLKQIKKIGNTGLDDGCRLFTDGIKVSFYTENKVYSIKLKK